MLHAAAEDAAAQKERIHYQRAGSGPEDRDAGEAIISEPVLYRNREAFGIAERSSLSCSG